MTALTPDQPPMIAVIKVGPGCYETAQGHQIDWKAGHRVLGTRSGWFVTFPGENSPDLSFSTLREARRYLAQPGGES